VFPCFYESAGLRMPTVCPHVWANESIPFNHIDPKIVDFPGIFGTNRSDNGTRFEFESLQGHCGLFLEIAGQKAFVASAIAVMSQDISDVTTF